MIIYPAIDIKNGKVVRLKQGDFDQVTQYTQEPIDAAKQWADCNASWIHIIDLDGAKNGTMSNRDAIIKIARTLPIPIQTGGGIRNENDISQLIDGGVQRVILSTKAIEDRVFLKAMVKKYPNQIAVSLDCKDGKLTQRGWVDTTSLKATEFIKELEYIGVSCGIYTDIARDGMLTGPNFEQLNEILNVTKIPIIASGGVSKLQDIIDLKALESKGISGVITGKALYEGTLKLEDALLVAQS